MPALRMTCVMRLVNAMQTMHTGRDVGRTVEVHEENLNPVLGNMAKDPKATEDITVVRPVTKGGLIVTISCATREALAQE
eukprot:6074079-Amphidinium_carterae.1